MEPTTPIESQKLINPAKITQVGGSGQNLISPSKLISVVVRPRGFWKSIVLDVLAVIFAGCFGYSYHGYLSAGFSPWFIFFVLLLWTTVSVLQGFLEKNTSRRFFVLLLETVALLVFFYDYNGSILFFTGLAVLVILFWGYLAVRREISNSIGIRFFTASGKIVGKVVTAAAVFIVAMYASIANGQGNFFLSEQGFSFFFNWTSGFVNNFYPTIPLNTSFNDFAQAIAKMELQNNPTFQSMTTGQQSVALGQAAGQVANVFSGNASGTSAIDPSEPTSNVVYAYAEAKLADLENRFQNVFLGIWGLILFFILRSIGVVFVWIAQLFSLVFYEILLATGFMRIGEQPQTKEMVEY